MARVAVDHLGLGAMTATYLFGALDHRHADDVRPAVYDVGGIADSHRRRRMAVAPDRQSRHFADFRVRRHESARLRLSPARPRLRRLLRRRRPLGIAPLAVDRADRRLGRGRSDSARNPLRFGKQRQHHRAMAAQGGPRRGRDGLVRLSPVLVLDAARAPQSGDGGEFARRQARQAAALHRRIRRRSLRRPAEGGRSERFRSRPRRARSSRPASTHTRSDVPFASSSISIPDRNPIPNCASSSRRPVNPSARHGSIDGQPDDAGPRGAGDAARGAAGDARSIAAAVQPRRAARVGGAAARPDALARRDCSSSAARRRSPSTARARCTGSSRSAR